MDDDRDDLLARVVASLRPLPVVDDTAKAQVLIAIAAERERERERAVRRKAYGRWTRWAVSATTVAAAAGLVGIVLQRDGRIAPNIVQQSVAPTPSAASVQLARTGTASRGGIQVNARRILNREH